MSHMSVYVYNTGVKGDAFLLVFAAKVLTFSQVFSSVCVSMN